MAAHHVGLPWAERIVALERAGGQQANPTPADIAPVWPAALLTTGPPGANYRY